MGAVLQIGYSKRAANTPAAVLIAEGWHALVEQGLTYEDLGSCPVGDSDEVIHAAGDDGDLVGVLAFRPDPARGVAFIVLAYVEPTSRRRGIFDAMMGRLAAECRANGIGRVMLETHVENKEMQAAMRRMDVQPVMLTYDLRIEPEPADDRG